jgi:hypothetical protein|nr:MAG TPA: hypothetical protein [Caudoviricetes sp.]
MLASDKKPPDGDYLSLLFLIHVTRYKKMELNTHLMSLVLMANLIIFILIFLYAGRESERNQYGKTNFKNNYK